MEKNWLQTRMILYDIFHYKERKALYITDIKLAESTCVGVQLLS